MISINKAIHRLKHLFRTGSSINPDHAINPNEPVTYAVTFEPWKTSSSKIKKPVEIKPLEEVIAASPVPAIVPTEKKYINDYFDKIFVINLDRRPDRKANLLQKLYELNIEAAFIEAVDGYTDENINEFNRYNSIPYTHPDAHPLEIKHQRKMIMSPGAWGVLKSYHKVIALAKEKGYRRILVFEDDIIFIEDFHARFANFIRSIGSDWKIICLGASQHVWNYGTTFTYYEEGANTYDPAKPYYHPIKTDGAFAVGYDHSIYDLLQEEIAKMNCAYDSGPMRKVFQTYTDKCYVAQPNLVIADVSQSDIGENRQQEQLAERLKWNMQLYDTKFKPELISVIMPAFNASATIRKSIQSLQAQSYSNIEIIVVDDGSTDDTVSIVEEIASKDNRVKLIRNEQNRGCYFVRNEGLRAARGKYIAINDADDIALNHRLARQVIPLLSGDAEFTIGKILRSRCSIEELEPEKENEMLKLVYSKRVKNPEGKYAYADKEILALGTSMFTRNFFEKHGLFWEERHSADAEIFERYFYNKYGILFKEGELNVHTFLFYCDPIPRSYKRMDDLLLICPALRETNLTKKYPIRSEERNLFEKNWRARLIGNYTYDYPRF